VFQVPGPLFLETRLLRIIERLLSTLDDFIICGSFYTYAKYLDIGLSESKLSPTAFGVDTRKFTRSMNQEKRRMRRVELGIPEEATVFVMVAYVYPPKSFVFRGRGIKGHETLIEAWGKFSNIEKDVFLVLVGDEWPSGANRYKDFLEARLDTYSKPSSFKWFTGITDSREFYEIADISISPSLSENHGAVLEASCMEVPSVISSAGALREGLPIDWPWIFAPEDASELYDCLRSSLLAYSRGELRSMGSLARKHVEEKFDCYTCAADISAAILAKR
jgi:glycosyltransferase involved in cell wall biosynthesis